VRPLVLLGPEASAQLGPVVLRPGGDRNPRTGSANARKLVRRTLRVGREDDPEGRCGHVELGVAIGQRLCVALVEPNGQARLVLRRPRLGELVGRNVEAGHLGAAARRAQRNAAGTAREVEEALPCRRSELVDDELVSRSERLCDPLVGGAAPLGRLTGQSASPIALFVSSVRTFQSSGKSLRLTSFESSSTGVPCVPTTSPPMMRSTTM
jgi:hypothetical protein